jgi:hypothetical protein
MSSRSGAGPPRFFFALRKATSTYSDSSQSSYLPDSHNSGLVFHLPLVLKRGSSNHTSMESYRRRGRSKSGYVWLLLCLGAGIYQGCARPDAFRRTGGGQTSAPAEQNLPFHQNPERAVDDKVHPAVPADRKSAAGAPFRTASHSGPHSLPAGTLITVRLESALPISGVRPGEAFSASVAGPINIDGDMMVERGTPVSGCVEIAQPSVDRPGLSPDAGFVRLILKTITIDGSAVPLQTSSLFAKGTWRSSGGPAALKSFWVEEGRRLTFRLTAPVTLTGPSSIANRQPPGTSSE